MKFKFIYQTIFKLRDLIKGILGFVGFDKNNTASGNNFELSKQTILENYRTIGDPHHRL